MSINIEIIGAPASGKTYFYNYLVRALKKRKNLDLDTTSLKHTFLFEYLKKKTKVNALKKIIYSYYIKNFQIKSNYLFKKEYKDLNLFIIKKLKNNKKYKEIINLYQKYIDTTKYTDDKKFRMIKNFEIDYLGSRVKDLNYKFKILDEGFFQKIYVNFQGNNNLHFNKKNQKKYLKLVPNPNLIILFNTSIKTCLNRAKKRKDGFLYKARKINYVSSKNYFNQNVINYATENKIPILTLNGVITSKKNVQIFFKKIQNYKKNFK